MPVNRPSFPLPVGTGCPRGQHPGASSEYNHRYHLQKLVSAPQMLASSGSGQSEGCESEQLLGRHGAPSFMDGQVRVTDDRLQPSGSDELIPSAVGLISGAVESSGATKPREEYLLEYSAGVLNARQINNAFTHPHGASVMDRFMTDDSDVAGLHAYACDLMAVVYELPRYQSDRLAPDLTKPPPSPPPPPPPPPPKIRIRDRRQTLEAGHIDVGRMIENRLDDQRRQCRKHGVAKQKNHRRARGARRPPADFDLNRVIST